MSRRGRKAAGGSESSIDAIESVDPAAADAPPAAADSPIKLEALLMRPPTADESTAWAVLSPALRRRAIDRIALLRRWWGDRDGLTAKDAASIAGVIPNRFYQMAAAWRRKPGLSAVGAYAAAPAVRSPRIDPLVNASLQANVVKVVAEGGDGSVEAMRRRLEELVAADLLARRRVAAAADGRDAGMATVDGVGRGAAPPDDDFGIPSPTVVRAIITRELNRVGEAQLLGESIAMDCCPTTMRSPTGAPWALFAIIDRGTLRVLGVSVGFLDDSAEGYSMAARQLLVRLAPGAPSLGNWARRTRRVDMVVGDDRAACDALIAAYGETGGPIEFKPVTRPRRFGSLLRRYVGERVGRVQLRPGWAASPPPMDDGEQTFASWDAMDRAVFEARNWNETRALVRPAVGEARPPDEFVALVRLLVGPGGPAPRDWR